MIGGPAIVGRAILSKSRMSSDSWPITPRFMGRPSTDLGADRIMTGEDLDDNIAIE
jgi:hypothetical protein